MMHNAKLYNSKNLQPEEPEEPSVSWEELRLEIGYWKEMDWNKEKYGSCVVSQFLDGMLRESANPNLSFTLFIP